MHLQKKRVMLDTSYPSKDHLKESTSVANGVPMGAIHVYYYIGRECVHAFHSRMLNIAQQTLQPLHQQELTNK